MLVGRRVNEHSTVLYKYEFRPGIRTAVYSRQSQGSNCQNVQDTVPSYFESRSTVRKLYSYCRRTVRVLWGSEYRKPASAFSTD